MALPGELVTSGIYQDRSNNTPPNLKSHATQVDHSEGGQTFMGISGKVVFASGRSTDFDIWLLELSSGQLTQLTRGEHFNDHPKWSPDGQSIAYLSRREDGVSSLWVMDGNGENPRQLTDGISCASPTWGPEGRTIYFTGNAAFAGEMSVCAYSLDTGKIEPICDYPGIESALSCSPDGSRLIFASVSSHLDAYRPRGATDIIEYDLTHKVFNSIFEHPAKENDPVYSPDGTRIAFTSHRNDMSEEDFQRAFNEYRQVVMEGTNAEARAAMIKLKSFQGDSDVYVASNDGTNLIMLTNDGYVDRGVCWSPCSNYLMYSSHAEKGQGTDRLHIINSLNGEVVPFEYDRQPLERDMGVGEVLNQTWMQRLTPDTVERMFLEPQFLGSERHPDWTK